MGGKAIVRTVVKNWLYCKKIGVGGWAGGWMGGKAIVRTVLLLL